MKLLPTKSKPASKVAVSRTKTVSPSTSKAPAEPKIKPFAHQLKSLKHGEGTNIVYDLSDPGTGKTFVRIMAFAARHKRLKHKAIVLAPKSLLRAVWANDVKKFAPHLRVAVSTAGKHEAVFDQDADIYVTNIDAVKWLAKQGKGFFDRFKELIIDESSAYKHATSQRSKAALRISKSFEFKACLTATPNSNSITDVWHQVAILDGGKRLGASFYAFRNAVCTPTQVGRDPNAVQWKDKDGAEEAVFGLLSDIVIRHRFEDCVDIPANHQYTISYQLAPRHMTSYLEMQEDQMMKLFGPVENRVAARMKGVKPTPIGTITAVHAGAAAQKLMQIASGAVYETPDKYHVIDTGRYEMILDLVEERKHSLVFFLWKHQRDLLLSEAESRGITFALIDGTTPDKEREQIVARYQRGEYQTLFAHPKSAAHGLTLTKGTATIWASPTHDTEVFVQGSKRQHRMGQTQKTETIVVVANGTVDQKVYDNMLGKGARMTNLLDLFSTL